ncbi:hypothetical protein L3Y34_013612 [Caenorhabditis briggsae]|uniref:Uncharacterized protein n=1 Tax=Caenorhabditis briggsae TaxID=6238 RepID=A0AAE9A1S5_CAEBR|nr:hypothetical protein L3Y34_013612 [Caenorhabditis briggsae]
MMKIIWKMSRRRVMRRTKTKKMVRRDEEDSNDDDWEDDEDDDVSVNQPTTSKGKIIEKDSSEEDRY